MKPLGPIPKGFGSLDGELAIDGRRASELVGDAGRTPLFVYSSAMIGQRIADLRAAMPQRMKLNYAIKANSYSPLLKFVSGLVDGLDIASGGELDLVRSLGTPGSRVSFAGPGKRDEELQAAIEQGVTLNLESENEAERALAIASRCDRKPRLAIRVNPDFETKGSGMKMGGGAKPFGIDADRVPSLARKLFGSDCEWQGFHIFAGSQSLDAAALVETQTNTLLLAKRLAEQAGVPLPKLNMGGGFGIPYFHGNEQLDIAHIGQALSSTLQSMSDTFKDTDLYLELGRYLVGEAGVYLTRIVDRKTSHGQTFLVTDGGLHHQLAASGNFGTVVRRNYPVTIATRFAAEPEEEVNIVGCLCTPLDRLADNAHLPRAEVGDIVAIFCAGAYGASASPSAFLGQGPAAEMLV